MNSTEKFTRFYQEFKKNLGFTDYESDAFLCIQSDANKNNIVEFETCSIMFLKTLIDNVPYMRMICFMKGQKKKGINSDKIMKIVKAIEISLNYIDKLDVEEFENIICVDIRKKI